MSAKTLYFPICLLRGFEDNEQETAKKILKYCHDVISKKHNPKEATKQLNCRIDFEINYCLDPNSPTTYINADFVKNIAEGCEIDYQEKCVFLYVCAVNSISKKDYFLTNWNMIATRASGYKTPDNKRELKGISKRFLARTHKFRQMLIDNAFEKYGVSFYSCVGLHGFYVYRNMTKSEFLEIENATIKKQTKKTFNTEKTRKTQQKISIENKISIVKTFANAYKLNYDIGADFITHIEAKKILLKEKDLIINELKNYYN